MQTQQKFRIVAQHVNGGDGELFTDLTRMEALNHVEQRGDHGGISIVEGVLGVQLQQRAMHVYISTDKRFKVSIEAVK